MKTEIFLIAVIYFTAAVTANTTTTPSLPKLPYAHYWPNGTLIWFPSIVGGTPVKLGDFHGQASLQTRNGSHICSATLISLEHVLTAAHCVTDEKGSVLNHTNFQIIADSINITKPYSNSTQIRYAVNIVAHPLFQVWNYQNDYAIIRVNSKFKITSTLNPIVISAYSPTPNQRCKLAAAGNVTENSGSHITLRKFDYAVLKTDQCNSTQFFNGLVPLNSFCGSIDLPGACQGDSGAALICENHIAGIVSFGYDCVQSKKPIVFSDVAIQNHWIDSVVNQTNLTHIPASVFSYPFSNSSTNGTNTTTTRRPGTGPGGASSIKYSLLLVIMSLLILYFVEYLTKLF